MAEETAIVRVDQQESGTDATNSTQERIFGQGFPGRSRDGKKWVQWVEQRIEEQKPAMQDKYLHYARHRHFRHGRQWISVRDGRGWRPVEGEKNTIRAVFDQIGPAIDFRIGIITEQRPGFKTYPLGSGTNAKETAEAQQMVAEFHFNRLNGTQILRSAKSNAYTDGVAFAHVYVDKNAGPKKEQVELVPKGDERFEMLEAQGYEVVEGNVQLPLTVAGDHAPVGVAAHNLPLGEIATRIVRAHEVHFDVEARSVNGPLDRAKWCVLRRIRDLNAARIETGNANLKADASAQLSDPVLDTFDSSGVSAASAGFQRGLPPFPVMRTGSRRQMPAVYDYLIYIAPAPEAGLEDGLWRRVIGDKVLAGGEELPGGKIPLARFTDGSTDDDMYPTPVMSAWINDQVSINALWSKLLEHARIFGTGRLMAQKGQVITETYSSIVGSLLEYTGAPPKFVQGTRVSGDLWQQLDKAVKAIQDKTGWNDFARGQVTGSGTLSDVSGRALLGAKEMFERQFANDIRAAAEGMSELAALWVDYSRWLYDEPRMIPFLGRGDLAKKIEGKDLGEDTVVYVDAETMVLMPKSLRNQMLVDLVDRGWITLEEYKRRAPFADIRNVFMGDQPQWERAQWINTFIEEKWQELAKQKDFVARFSPGIGMPILWQDDPKIHKRALEELIYDEMKPLPLRDIAMERWGMYDQLAQSQAQETEQGLIPGIPLAEPVASVVRGVPQHLAQQAQIAQPVPPAGAVPSGQPGAEGAPVAGAPDLASVQPAAAEAPALGEFGAVEEQQVV